MKKTLVLSLVAAVLFAAALFTLPVSAAKGDNLAAGKTVDVRLHTDGNGTPDGYNTDLTDGKTADTFNWADGSWFSFQIHNNTDEAGYGVLTVDLRQAAAIGQVRVHTLFADGSNGGVGNPRSVKLELSADNSAWQTVETKEYEPSVTADWDPQWIEFNAGNADARYVRLTFEQTQAFVMIDEVEVREGERGTAPEEPSSEEPSSEPSEEPSEAVSSEAPSEPSEETAGTVSEETSAASSEAVAGTETSSPDDSEEESQGNGMLIGILIAAAAVVAIAVAAVVILRKRKG